MNTLDLDVPEDILEYLAEPIKAVYEGLDHAVSLAAVKMADVPDDPWLRAHWIRFGACQHLGSIQPVGWSWRELPNSGIEVLCGPIVFRVLKARDGTVPHPGSNEARRDYWCQLPLPLQMSGATFPISANLLVDWEVGENEQISLALSKPSGTWAFHGKPVLEWRRHVVVETGKDLKFTTPSEDISVEPRFAFTELDEEGIVE